MSTERDDLQNLIASPGWQMVTKRVRKVIEDNLQQQLSHVLTDASQEAATKRILQLVAQRQVLDEWIHWPEERIKQLEAQAIREHAVPSTSRRGGL